MATLKLAAVASAGDDRVLIGKSKILGPIIALAFPSLFVIFLVAGFIRTGFDFRSFLAQGVLVATIVPGAIVMAYWCKRYTGPALHALRQREAIAIENGQLAVYHDRYVISDDASLDYNATRISLVERGAVVTTVPGYFIRIIRNSA
ncbi:MAG: hypothetical protein ACTHN4_02340 [Sphingomicrobium sp.]